MSDKNQTLQSVEDDQYDAMGFATHFPVITGDTVLYFRKRMPRSAADLFHIKQNLNELLRSSDAGSISVLRADDEEYISVSLLARRSLDLLNAAEEKLLRLPSEHQELGWEIFKCALFAGQHEASAILRSTGLPNAHRGKKADRNIARMQAKSLETRKARHPQDLENFRIVDQLIRDAHDNGEELKVRAAARKILYPQVSNIPMNERKEADKAIDAFRKRYERYKYAQSSSR